MVKLVVNLSSEEKRPELKTVCRCVSLSHSVSSVCVCVCVFLFMAFLGSESGLLLVDRLASKHEPPRSMSAALS